jgi:hypothetical protein
LPTCRGRKGQPKLGGGKGKALGTHLELGNVEAIHVVNMRIEPPRQMHILAKLLATEALEALLAERQSRLDELDVRTFPQSVSDDRFVLLGRDAAGRVDDVASFLRVGGDRVDGAEDELLLEVGEEGEVALGLLGESGRAGAKVSDEKRREKSTKRRTLLTLTL